MHNFPKKYRRVVQSSHWDQAKSNYRPK